MCMWVYKAWVWDLSGSRVCVMWLCVGLQRECIRYVCPLTHGWRLLLPLITGIFRGHRLNVSLCRLQQRRCVPLQPWWWCWYLACWDFLVRERPLKLGCTRSLSAMTTETISGKDSISRWACTQLVIQWLVKNWLPLINHKCNSHLILQSSNEIPRSLEIQDFKINILPTSGKVNLPTMVKLFPGSTKPLHLHANLPLRFGRESDLGDRLPKSTLNLPQRFGRSGTVIQSCSECPHLGVVPSATLPQRFGRNSPFRNLFRTKGHARIIKAVPGKLYDKHAVSCLKYLCVLFACLSPNYRQ